MEEFISIGRPITLTEDVVYALPARRGWLIANAVLEFSLQSTTGFTAVAASTTGMEVQGSFCRCTTSGGAIVHIHST